MKHLKRTLLAAVAAAAVAYFVYALATTPSSAKRNPASASARPAFSRKVDHDFTQMSQTMQAAQLYRMMTAPDDFAGTTVRVDGLFLTRVDESDGTRRFACQIGGPGCSCCAAGVVEFVPGDAYRWPDGFPATNSPVVVTGLLEVQENGDEHQSEAVPRLVDADLSF